MKRRSLLVAIGLGPTGAGLAAAAPALPAVLRTPATVLPLATRAAILTAARTGRRLVIAGERGIVLWSDDDGANWTQARVPVQVGLTAMAFANDQEGWAAGHFGVLLHTRDRGESWTLAMDGQRAADLQQRAASGEAEGRAAARLVEEGADKPFFDLALVRGRPVAVGAYGLALRAEGSAGDGDGFTAFGSGLPNPRQLHLYAVKAAGDRVYVAGEQGLLLRSGDAGERFESVPMPYKGSFFGLVLLGPGALLAYGLRGNIWRSTDEGASWQQVANPLPVSLSAGSVLDDGRVVLLAQNGDLLVSRDQGASFEHRAAAEPFPAATMVADADGRHLMVGGLRGVTRLTLA